MRTFEVQGPKGTTVVPSPEEAIRVIKEQSAPRLYVVVKEDNHVVCSFTYVRRQGRMVHKED